MYVSYEYFTCGEILLCTYRERAGFHYKSTFIYKYPVIVDYLLENFKKNSNWKIISRYIGRKQSLYTWKVFIFMIPSLCYLYTGGSVAKWSGVSSYLPLPWFESHFVKKSSSSSFAEGWLLSSKKILNGA